MERMDRVDLEIADGTANLSLNQVAHVIVPGRGRSSSGFGLSEDAAKRIKVARALYDLVVKPNGGRIVCSGYKSPADSKGVNWSPPDSPHEVFRGMPEADIMRDKLIDLGVNEQHIFIERHSIDTATNFLRSELEGHFGDTRPVAIVAQSSHLRRILTIIAPRTLRRPYLGVPIQEAIGSTENPVANLVSTCVLACLPDQTDKAIAIAQRRAAVLWRMARLAGVRQYY
jgi:uncharacterized SAM-binding protein YcdF (DUF218 family)